MFWDVLGVGPKWQKSLTTQKMGPGMTSRKWRTPQAKIRRFRSVQIDHTPSRRILNLGYLVIKNPPSKIIQKRLVSQVFSVSPQADHHGIDPTMTSGLPPWPLARHLSLFPWINFRVACDVSGWQLWSLMVYKPSVYMTAMGVLLFSHHSFI